MSWGMGLWARGEVRVESREGELRLGPRQKIRGTVLSIDNIDRRDEKTISFLQLSKFM